MKNSGVLLLFFDLPSKTPSERRSYRKFIKYIKSVGFLMLQESVYIKLQKNTASTMYDVNDLRKNAAADGSIMLLPLTVTNFSRLISVKGDMFDIAFLCDDFIVV